MDQLMILTAKYFYLVVVLIGIIALMRTHSISKKQYSIFAVASLVVAFLLGQVASLLIKDPRPFVSDHVTPLISHAPSNGFPSDHTLLAATVAAIIFAYNRWLGVILLPCALLVGYSRVYVRVHHWEDIIGSFVIAGISVVVVYLLLQKQKKQSTTASHAASSE